MLIKLKKKKFKKKRIPYSKNSGLEVLNYKLIDLNNL